MLPERIAPPATLSGEVVTRAQLPAEGVQTLDLILRGGPFPYRKDGSTFHNREGLLPDRPRGHYREYTVPTPGSPDRGARRIVTGGDPPEVFYYTADHYRSFRRIGDAR
nr:ribonuclease domain-containing protein [Pseudazoarcus pumilus]